MLRSLFITILVLLLGAGAITSGVGLWWVKNGVSTPGKPSDAKILPATTYHYSEVPTLPVIMAETSGASEQYFECHQATCRPRRPPKNTETIRFDGAAWYFYEENGSLHKVEGGEENVLLVAPTELVKPRDIIPAVGSGRVAYWLDDTTKAGEGLTELWVYSGADGGTFVVGEKLVAADVVTQPRWNAGGSALWFLADSGEGSREKIEFVVAHTSPPHITARFASTVTEALQQAATQGLVDISPSGTTMAFASENTGSRHTLHIVRDAAATEIKQIAGRIAHLQWVGEGELLYAIQGRTTIEFWHYMNATHSLIAKQPGLLLTARADSGGQYIAYGAKENEREYNLRILDVSTGLSRLQSPLPRKEGVHIVHVGDHSEPDARSVTAELTDGQLVAFIESQSDRIVGRDAILTRMVMADRPNTLYVDFEQGGEAQRMLITVRDAVHPEWAILGRYRLSGGQWQRVQGGGQDPKSLRLYEWEEAAHQWILKQSLDN